MAVRIRLSRYGRLHRPYFRIVAIDGRCHREGKANEILGSYDPLLKDKNISVDMEAVGRWVERGALISVGLSKLMKHFGYVLPKPATTSKPAAATPAKQPAKTGAKGVKQPWSAPTRRAVRKHSAKLKGVRKAALAAAAPAKPAAEAAASAEPATKS